MKKTEIVALQQALEALGYTLPRFGADGQLGPETCNAYERFMESQGMPGEDVVTDEGVTFVLRARDRWLALGPSSQSPARLIDRRQFASREHDYGRREWTGVKGICLHQTACDMGERSARYDTIGAHVVVTRSGSVLWIHDFDRLIVHGNGWNTQCVGIEINGLFEGIAGDPRTLWDDPSTPARERGMQPTLEQLGASCQAIRWICDIVRRRGGQVHALVSHRQASANRRNDPGSAIWKSVALPMMAELKLTDGGLGFKIGSGYPNPEAWDPSRKGIPY